MKLFIDSSQKEYAFCLFDEKFNILFSEIVETKFKVEEIINSFSQIKEQVQKIDGIYINKGPGSFTGSRVALLYVKVLSIMLEINIYSTNTFEIIKHIERKENVCINATKNNSFCYINNTITKTAKQQQEESIDYSKLFSEFGKYIDIFEIDENVEPVYGSNPQIGAKK